MSGNDGKSRKPSERVRLPRLGEFTVNRIEGAMYCRHRFRYGFCPTCGDDPKAYKEAP